MTKFWPATRPTTNSEVKDETTHISDTQTGRKPRLTNQETLNGLVLWARDSCIHSLTLSLECAGFREHQYPRPSGSKVLTLVFTCNVVFCFHQPTF